MRTHNDWSAMLKAEREGKESPGTCVKEMAAETKQVFLTGADVRGLIETAKTPEIRKLLTDMTKAADQIAAALAALDKRWAELDAHAKTERANLEAETERRLANVEKEILARREAIAAREQILKQFAEELRVQ